MRDAIEVIIDDLIARINQLGNAVAGNEGRPSADEICAALARLQVTAEELHSLVLAGVSPSDEASERQAVLPSAAEYAHAGDASDGNASETADAGDSVDVSTIEERAAAGSGDAG